RERLSVIGKDPVDIADAALETYSREHPDDRRGIDSLRQLDQGLRQGEADAGSTRGASSPGIVGVLALIVASVVIAAGAAWVWRMVETRGIRLPSVPSGSERGGARRGFATAVASAAGAIRRRPPPRSAPEEELTGDECFSRAPASTEPPAPVARVDRSAAPNRRAAYPAAGGRGGSPDRQGRRPARAARHRRAPHLHRQIPAWRRPVRRRAPDRRRPRRADRRLRPQRHRIVGPGGPLLRLHLLATGLRTAERAVGGRPRHTFGPDRTVGRDRRVAAPRDDRRGPRGRARTPGGAADESDRRGRHDRGLRLHAAGPRLARVLRAPRRLPGRRAGVLGPVTQHDRHGTVVHEGDGHIRAEAPRLDAEPPFAE